MIILNIELGEELENKFYDRIRDKDLNYLEYVEQLIKDDLKLYPYSKEEEFMKNSKDGEQSPILEY